MKNKYLRSSSVDDKISYKNTKLKMRMQFYDYFFSVFIVSKGLCFEILFNFIDLFFRFFFFKLKLNYFCDS